MTDPTAVSDADPRVRRLVLPRYLAVACAAFMGMAIALPAPALATAASPGTVVAPYMDMVGSNQNLLTTALSGDLNDFSAGFVLGRNAPGHGCEPVWDDEVTSATDTSDTNVVNNRIDNAVDRQGNRVTPIISFGGQGGFDLAITCTSVGALTAAYESVIQRFGVKRVDFDVEGDALNDSLSHASIVRRFTAIGNMKNDIAGLKVSFTLPSDYYGLADDGVNFLNLAKGAGIRPDVVNIMAMEFSTPPPGTPAAASMGAATINAARRTLAQMQNVWSTAPVPTFQNLGITPMIGQNINGKVFTLTASGKDPDAKLVVDFARSNKVGRLAYWSLNRDRACNPSTEDLSACSKVSQSPLAFTNAFLKVHTASK